jgi:hypothetical protein
MTERLLDADDVISLLRSDIDHAAGIIAWSKKSGIHRSTVSKVLHKFRPPTKGIIRVLKLRAVWVRER